MIPIRNIYAMLAFCWRETDLVDDGDLGECDFDNHRDVAARLLDIALRRLFKRGLEVAYTEVEQAGPRPRGSLDLARTTRELLTARGALAFRVDELSEDTAANRLLKCAAALLLQSGDVDTAVRQRLRTHVARLAAVKLVSPLAAVSVTVRVPRHERAYREALWLAQLTLASLLPDEGERGSGRSRALRIEDKLPLLFQGFVRGAAQHFLAGSARVSAPNLSWDVENASPRAQGLIPQMRSDATVTWNTGPRAILECKFYDAPLAQAAFASGERFHISHLYQIVSYVNVLARTGPQPSATLVYGSPGGSLDEKFRIQGVNLRVVWLNLAATWPMLRNQVVDVVSWPGLELSTGITPATA